MLANLGVRFLILGPPPPGWGGDELPRRIKLAREIVESGGPPIVLLPVEWPPEVVAGFVETVVERLLHDASLDRAAARASVG